MKPINEWVPILTYSKNPALKAFSTPRMAKAVEGMACKLGDEERYSS